MNPLEYIKCQCNAERHGRTSHESILDIVFCVLSSLSMWKEHLCIECSNWSTQHISALI